MKRQLAQKLRNSKEGFSIIEVMIVLAVAAVIMVIVFLAVPALQRNNRNTQRRTDVNNLVSAVNEFMSNNGGKVPTDVGDFSGNVKFGIYGSDTNVSIKAASNATGKAGTGGGTGAGPGADKVEILTATKCGSTPTANPVAGTSRQFAAWFSVETSSGTTAQCVEG